jgi:hypothetical protein
MISSIQAQKKMREKKTLPSPSNKLATTILPEMDSNRTASPCASPCLLKLQKGFEHQNMLNLLFTIIHSRLGENDENKCYYQSSNL